MLHKRISAVSKIRNTTKTVIKGVLNWSTTQFIFYDTPGITVDTSKKQFVQKVRGVIKESYAVIMIIDVAKNITKDLEFLTYINTLQKPIIVILSKIDLIKKSNVLPIIEKIQPFLKEQVTEIIPLDLINDDYQQKIIIYLQDYALKGQPLYNTTLTGFTSLTLIKHLEQLILEAVFDTYINDVPHRVRINEIKLKNSHLAFQIITTNTAQKKLIIGKQGNKLQELREKILILAHKYKIIIKTVTIKVC